MTQFLFKCKFPLSSFPEWDASSSHGYPPPPPPSLPLPMLPIYTPG